MNGLRIQIRAQPAEVSVYEADGFLEESVCTFFGDLGRQTVSNLQE